ncbi:uncharacterized protein EV154DRAFT_483655 [Mucor mucedo]|uniref:uncharacterized protein n=1 Tax=Mucor mucedo TaxID=29922 RepID=UPI00221FDEDC|nr:uncharacterized protein EV154DRAFT_483655 [Mucor mucedo]KAI7888885.1 hypothetical protein EV154DRAFT_483655 [Mucor mucedo]
MIKSMNTLLMSLMFRFFSKLADLAFLLLWFFWCLANFAFFFLREKITSFFSSPWLVVGNKIVKIDNVCVRWGDDDALIAHIRCLAVERSSSRVCAPPVVSVSRPDVVSSPVVQDTKLLLPLASPSLLQKTGFGCYSLDCVCVLGSPCLAPGVAPSPRPPHHPKSHVPGFALVCEAISQAWVQEYAALLVSSAVSSPIGDNAHFAVSSPSGDNAIPAVSSPSGDNAGNSVGVAASVVVPSPLGPFTSSSVLAGSPATAGVPSPGFSSFGLSSVGLSTPVLLSPALGSAALPSVGCLSAGSSSAGFSSAGSSFAGLSSAGLSPAASLSSGLPSPRLASASVLSTSLSSPGLDTCGFPTAGLSSPGSASAGSASAAAASDGSASAGSPSVGSSCAGSPPVGVPSPLPSPFFRGAFASPELLPLPSVLSRLPPLEDDVLGGKRKTPSPSPATSPRVKPVSSPSHQPSSPPGETTSFVVDYSGVLTPPRVIAKPRLSRPNKPKQQGESKLLFSLEEENDCGPGEPDTKRFRSREL